MKMLKTRLRNRISDVNLPKLMHIAIEGPDLSKPFALEVARSNTGLHALALVRML